MGVQQLAERLTDGRASISAGQFGEQLLELFWLAGTRVPDEDQIAQLHARRKELPGQQVGTQRRDLGRIAAGVELAQPGGYCGAGSGRRVGRELTDDRHGLRGGGLGRRASGVPTVTAC